MTFSYLEEGHHTLTFPAKRAVKQGSGSTTRRMLVERPSEIDPQEEATRQSLVGWFLRNHAVPRLTLPSRAILLRRSEWRNALPTQDGQLQALILIIQPGNALEAHDNVPKDRRRQLYAAEPQHFERQHKAADKPALQTSGDCFQEHISGIHSDTMRQLWINASLDYPWLLRYCCGRGRCPGSRETISERALRTFATLL